MINRRLVANLIVFFVVSFALVVYGVVNLLGNPLQSPTMLTTEFADASGLYSGFEVELNGVPVGTVTSTALTKAATKVTMRINPGTTVPDDVQSSIQIANDLGEQVVNLVPTRSGAAPALGSGASVPAAPNQVPANVGAVVASATRLLQAIPGNDINKLIGELATSLAGQAGNLRTLISAGTTFSKEFVAYQQQFTELLANAPPSFGAITAVAPELRQDVANTAALVQVLAQQKSGLHTLLDVGIVRLQRGRRPPDVAVGQSGLLPSRHGRHPVQRRRAHQPDQSFAGAGLQPVLLRRGRQDRGSRDWPSPPRRAARTPNQTFLRTRLLIPPVLDEQAQSYGAANTIPDTLPGAGCVTVVRQRCRRRHPARFHTRRRGSRRGPSAQEADVEVASATPVGQVAERLVPRAGRPPGPAAGARRAGGAGPVPGLGRPPRRTGARAGGPERCPGAPRWRPGAVTHGGRTERHDHDRSDNGERSEGGRRARAGRRGADPRGVAAPDEGGARAVTAASRAGGPSAWSASWP